MASLMRDMGGGPPGANPFGARASSFPAPGMPSTAAAGTAPNAATTATAATGTPIAQPFNAGAAPGNPWASMFPPAGGAPASAGGAGANATTSPLMNPFTMNPALLQSMLDAGGGGLGAYGVGGGSAPAPADTRPPEERFQVQLQVCCSPLAHLRPTADRSQFAVVLNQAIARHGFHECIAERQGFAGDGW